MVANGSSNVYGLDKYCDLNKIKKGVDFDKLEEIEIISNQTELDFNVQDVLKEINSVLDNNKEQNQGQSYPSTPIQQPSSSPISQANSKLVDDYLENVVKKPNETNVNKFLYNKSLNISPDETRKREEKMQTLESIKHLRDELTRIGITLDDIPVVSSENSYEDVRQIYSILRYKKNLSINFEIAKDSIIYGVNQLSRVFDGSKTSFGTMPDLRGWNRTANLKLNSLKVELSNVVAEAFNYYNVGPVGQILLSLVPSALVHMSMKHEQKVSSVTTENVDESLQNLYDLNK